MKRLTVVLAGILLLMASCKERPLVIPDKEEPKEIHYVWTGQDKWDIAGRIPVCIVWYKYVQPPTDAWKPYKAFSQNDAYDMREIILRLMEPEVNAPNPQLKTHDKLSIVFYNGVPEKLTVREVYFEIKDDIFVGPAGKSGKIADILSARQEVVKHFYGVLSGHYREDFLRILNTQNSPILKDLKAVDDNARDKLCALYMENADPNEIGRLKSEWWQNVESEYRKYPLAYPDMNKVRIYQDDWWQLLEKKAAAQLQKDADANLPAKD